MFLEEYIKMMTMEEHVKMTEGREGGIEIMGESGAKKERLKDSNNKGAVILSNGLDRSLFIHVVENKKSFSIKGKIFKTKNGAEVHSLSIMALPYVTCNSSLMANDHLLSSISEDVEDIVGDLCSQKEISRYSFGVLKRLIDEFITGVFVPPERRVSKTMSERYDFDMFEVW